MPERIRLSRVAGFRLPETAKKVDRSTRFGNPWKIERVQHDGLPFSVTNVYWPCRTGFADEEQARHFAIDRFRRGLHMPSLFQIRITALEVVRELRGWDLACWCRLDQECHADVLLDVANAP